MRATAPRAFLPVAVGLLLLSGCSQDADDPSDPSSSEASVPLGPAAPPVSQEDAVVTFCAEGQAVFGQLSLALQNPEPTEIPGLLRQASDAFADVTAPPDIASDFETLRTAYAQLADVAAPLDLSTAEGKAEFQTSYQEIAGPALPAQDALSAWTQANCSTS